YERELRHDSVTPGYFRAMGTRLVSGRFLDERDREKSPPVTLVNETLAKKYFQAADPVGKRIKFGRPQDKDPWIPIVGVVADEQQDGMDVPVQPEAYVPIAQDTQNDMTFVIRTPLAIDALIAAARTQARAVDKDLAMTDVSTLGDVVAGSVGDQRFRTMLLSGFAGVALFLAALGIYGVLAYVVVQRAREIAIRLALGAAPARLLRMVVGQGLRPVLWGSIAGLAAAYVVTGLMKTLLFGIEPLDP